MDQKPGYDIVFSKQTLENIISYKNALSSKSSEPGPLLKKSLNQRNIHIDQIDKISDDQFIELLLSTKRPIIFAESEIRCDGTDWNRIELQLLGDLNIAMNVAIYDNGTWSPSDPNFQKHEPPLEGTLLLSIELQLLGDLNIAMNVAIYDNGTWSPSDPNFQKHEPPLEGTLLFMPGPLLKIHSMDGISPDLNEIINERNEIDQQKYIQLIERRLTPLLHYANEAAIQKNKSALITIPGIGCGSFAGDFHGRMGEHLNQALQYILKKHGKYYTHFACVYFDPFGECSNQQHIFENVKYRVRPAMQNQYKSQLCDPKKYQESGDDFSNCSLFKVVAWDHVSFPGNDYFAGSRNTDDGVSAAATNSMKVITGIEGEYLSGHYYPPKGNGERNWEQVTLEHDIKLQVKDNIKVISF